MLKDPISLEAPGRQQLRYIAGKESGSGKWKEEKEEGREKRSTVMIWEERGGGNLSDLLITAHKTHGRAEESGIASRGGIRDGGWRETGGEGGLSTPLSFSLPISSCGRSPPCSVIRLRIGVVHPLMLSSASAESPLPRRVARPPSAPSELKSCF